MSDEMEQNDNETVVQAADEARPAMTRSMSEDHLLQDLVLLAEQGVEVGVTLLLGGTMVSGMVASGKRYFEAITGEMVSASPAELKTMFESYFEDYSALYKKPIEDGRPATFIHLRDVRYWIPGGQVTAASSVWWRGRIDQVGGFQFGTPGQ